MEDIVRTVCIIFCSCASLAFAQLAVGETEKSLPKLDRLAPEHVEQATFALG